jgi:cell fate regulator YaaT (PSP1 superfamily)
MVICEAEFQFDRHKLTIYYYAEKRIDFRELVRDLFALYKARIWMKKLNSVEPFNFKPFAKMALATGVQVPI